MSRGWRGAPAAVLILVGLWPSGAFAQTSRTVGVHLGMVRAEQLWDDPVRGTRSNGFTIGIGVDVPTPVPAFSVRAGVGYVQRGSGVWDTELDPDGVAQRNVRSHYLSVPLEAKVGRGIGPVSLYLVAGPVIDLLLDTQCSQDLCPLLEEERPMLLNATIGAGLAIPLQERLWADVEIRLTEGLTSGYSTAGTGLRYRSVEAVVRTRFPF